jgi:hypothetical protein
MQIIDINGNTRECKSAVPDKNYPGFMKIEYISINRKGYTHFEWYQTTDFVKNNPKLSDLAKGSHGMAKEDLGAVTKAGEDWIADLVKDWPKDIYKGTPVWISRGKGEGQQRMVTGNDKNKLFIDKKWGTVPNSTSQYVISFNVSKDIKSAGNTLPGVETKEVLAKLIKKAKKSLIN